MVQVREGLESRELASPLEEENAADRFAICRSQVGFDGQNSGALFGYVGISGEVDRRAAAVALSSDHERRNLAGKLGSVVPRVQQQPKDPFLVRVETARLDRRHGPILAPPG